jgi:hypothetical protein
MHRLQLFTTVLDPEAYRRQDQEEDRKVDASSNEDESFFVVTNASHTKKPLPATPTDLEGRLCAVYDGLCVSHVVDAKVFQSSVLVFGEPGGGKTYSVKAAARSLGCAVVELSLGSIGSKYVSETEQRISKLLRLCQERRVQPAMILFDESDQLFAGESEHAKSIINQFKTMLGGDALKGVVVVAITNVNVWQVCVPVFLLCSLHDFSPGKEATGRRQYRFGHLVSLSFGN